MIRVAYIIDHAHVGGAQRHLIEVVRGLDRSTFAPELWTAAADPGELAPVFESLDCPVRSFGLRDTLISPRTLRAIESTAQDFRQRGVSIAHGYLFEGNLLAALTGKRARLPVTLVSKRSLDRYRRVDHRVAAWVSNLLADRVLVNADAVRDIVVDHEWCAPSRIDMIPNGVALPSAVPSNGSDVAPEEDPRGHGPLVGMVGRLSWKKGYEFALEAASLLRDRIAGLRFDIVGDGPLRADLEQQARERGLDDTVRFLGQRSDVANLMRRFDCYLLSSVIEGMPNALLEAMALERAVVTTSAGGSAQVVVDGESGLVVPPRDAPALAAAVERVLGDRELSRNLARAAGNRVRSCFSLEAMLASIDRLYRGQLARAGVDVGNAGQRPLLDRALSA